MTEALAGRSIFITGAASGLGRATALGAAAAGARVAMADISEAGLDEAAQAARAHGAEVLPLVCDVTDPQSVDAALSRVAARFGGLDAAVNNAGISEAAFGHQDTAMADLPDDIWHRIFDINLTGLRSCMKAEIALMRGQRAGGAIVNVSSIAGLVALPGRSAYVASKHAVIGLTRAAALDHGSASIRVNAVCPGYVETPFTRDTLQASGEAIRARVPAGRIARPEEVSGLILWLCSDAASFVTGAAYAVDGGYTAI